MTTVECITALFYQVDEQMHAIPKHPDAHLWPSEVVTLGLLHALKGGGNRAFYRWLTRDYRALFPQLSERTRLFRFFRTHQDWTQVFLAAPTVLGVIDTYGIERIHPIREGRSPQQIGRKGLSNHRWIVGGKLCLLLNQYGLVVAWECATANVAENTFQWLIRQFEERMIVLSDTAFHAAEGDPSNLKLCQRGEWQDRLLVKTVLSMLTLVSHSKQVMHRVSISTLVSRSPWRFSMCWSSGMAYSPTHLASCLSRSLNLVCKKLTPLVIIPATACHQRNDVERYSRSTRGWEHLQNSQPLIYFPADPATIPHAPRGPPVLLLIRPNHERSVSMCPPGQAIRKVLAGLTTLARQRTMRLLAGWLVAATSATSQICTHLTQPGARERPWGGSNARHRIGPYGGEHARPRASAPLLPRCAWPGAVAAGRIPGRESGFRVSPGLPQDDYRYPAHPCWRARDSQHGSLLPGAECN
jgi:hypothetical protein